VLQAANARPPEGPRRVRSELWILGIGWLAFLAIGFPGLVTRDSVDQLAEARSGFFTDPHPPLMSFIWRYVDMIVAGPLGMFVLQTGMLLAGLHLVFRRVLRPRTAALCALGVLWFPPISTPMMVVWKDAPMAGACMLSFGLLLGGTRRKQVAGLAVLTLGVALRYNALALALPMVVLLFEWRPGMRARSRYAIAVAAWLGVALAVQGINSLLTDRKMHFWSSTLAVMDIAGSICYESRPYSDAELEQLFAGTDLRVHSNIEATMCELFETSSPFRLTHPERGLWDLPTSGTIPAPPSRRDAIARVWLDVVPSRPVGYFKYRISVFQRVLAIVTPPWSPVPARVPRVARYAPHMLTDLGLATSHDNAVQAGYTAALTWLADHTPLFRPWLYLALALGLLAVVRRRAPLALLLSGLAMQGSLLLVAMSPDYRYSHWLVLTTIVVGVLWRIEVAETRKARQSPGPPRSR
jgi:hypothetical protein